MIWRDSLRARVRWWVKVLGQNALGLLPPRVGRALQQWIVHRLNGPLSEREYTSSYRLERAIRNVELLRRYTDFNPLNANVIEIGTGWRGCDALLFHALGASKVVTTDHQRWLSREGVELSVRQLIDAADDVIRLVSPQQGEGVRDRLERLSHLVGASQTLEGFLSAIDVEYRVIENGDIRQVPLGAWKADLFYSESVLQRIPRRLLPSLLRHYATDVCRPDSAWFHRTDQRDIHALSHARTGRWGLAYLYYPQWAFDLLINGRFTSQNRWRESDFVESFAGNGVTPRYIESRIDPEDVERVSESIGRLSAEFRGKSVEDIATRASIFVGVLSPGDGLRCERSVIHGEPHALER